MPTPLPQKSKISDGVGWPLERRPELSACIARIATFWSRIEERLAQTATHLLGAEPHAGIRMFQALPASSDRIAMVRALALDALSKEALHRLDELMVRYREAEWKRDKVVRGHWYVSDDHPDALVWADPADEITEASAFWSGYRSSKGFEDQLRFARDYERQRPDYFLFDKAEFESILEEFRALGFALTDFNLDIAEARTQAAEAES
jgi:hypothetical protein